MYIYTSTHIYMLDMCAYMYTHIYMLDMYIYPKQQAIKAIAMFCLKS